MSTTTMPEKSASETTIDALRGVLADTYLLMVKTHGYHWNVEGPHFHSLHLLFEEQYNDLFKAVDELAERIRALKARAPASLAAFSELSEINEGRPDTAWQDMVRQLQHDNEHLAEACRQGIDAADTADDASTADLLTGRQTVHEKAAWMLRSLLK